MGPPSDFLLGNPVPEGLPQPAPQALGNVGEEGGEKDQEDQPEDGSGNQKLLPVPFDTQIEAGSEEIDSYAKGDCEADVASGSAVGDAGDVVLTAASEAVWIGEGQVERLLENGEGGAH